MRLDLALKHSGLIKRRVVCKAYCERGLVLVNDKVGKPSSEVKDGDIIQITLGNKIIELDIPVGNPFVETKLSDINKMMDYSYKGCKYSYLLLAVLALPIKLSTILPSSVLPYFSLISSTACETIRPF